MKNILSTFLIGSVLIVTGCKKEKVFYEEELTGSKTGVGFGLPNQEPISLSVEGSTASYTEPINVFATNGVSATASIVVDESLVAAYNEANGTEFEVMPSDIYTFPSSIDVSGGSGSGDATFDIQKLLTYGSSFAIGIKISSVSGGTDYIQSGNSEKVIIVQVKNKYDGLFGLVVRTDGWAVYGIADGVSKEYPGDIAMVTASANSVDLLSLYRGDNLLPAFTSSLQATAFGATSARLTFDLSTDKLVSVVNTTPDDGRQRTLRINPAVTDSRYDASTGTIYAAFIMGQAGRPDQYFYDTLTYRGPR